MAEIILPTSENPDIYTYGFGRNLNRPLTEVRQNLAYSVFDSRINILSLGEEGLPALQGLSTGETLNWEYIGKLLWTITTANQRMAIPVGRFDLIKVLYRSVNDFAGASNLLLRLNGVTATNYHNNYIDLQTGGTSTIQTDTASASVTLNQMQAQNDVVVGRIIIQAKHTNGIKSIMVDTHGKVTASARKGLGGALTSDSDDLKSVTLLSTQNTSGRADFYGYIFKKG